MPYHASDVQFGFPVALERPPRIKPATLISLVPLASYATDRMAIACTRLHQVDSPKDFRRRLCFFLAISANRSCG